MASETTRGLYLQWEGKKLYRQRIPAPRVLEPVEKLSVGTDRSSLIIEGDNLQALASLASQYAGQVDVIYIDPPYNTGKKDFRYSDKRFQDPDADNIDEAYVSNEDGGRHTKWLNFMAPRLHMLKKLLHKERGVIFTSINDVELFRLGMLMNEVFGEDNLLGTIIWKGTTDNNPTRIAVEHEYVLCYARTKSKQKARWSNPDNEAKALMLENFERIKEGSSSLVQLKREFDKFAKAHKVQLKDLYRYRNVDNDGPYVARRNLENPGKPGYDYDIIHPTTKKPCARPYWGWRYPQETMDQLLAEKRIIFGKAESKIPELKVPLREVEFPLRSVIYLDSRKGSNDLERLFGSRDRFKNPKPVELLETLLGYASGKESIVLDAFAGSGTTAEAVLRLNSRDGGKRRFILIEDGEKGDRFCRDLTAERVRLAIEKDGHQGGFQFLTTGRKIDRAAIVDLERDSLASLICQSDETGRGRGISAVQNYKYLIGRNHRSEGICLVWNGSKDSEVTPEKLRECSLEVSASGLKRPFRVYGTFCRVGDTTSWKFCQIPDDILTQMHLREDIDEVGEE